MNFKMFFTLSKKSETRFKVRQSASVHVNDVPNDFFQECVFEKLEVKQKVFQEAERLVGADVILSSSTSCLVPSAVFSEVQNKSRCLVAHPVSAPPHHFWLICVILHKWTFSMMRHHIGT